MKNYPLTIELIPRPMWGINVRSEVPGKVWNQIRSKVAENANYLCETCLSNRGEHCHEVWDFELNTATQRLVGLIWICPDCHLCKHLGRARATGQYDIALKHLKKVNEWSEKEADREIKNAFSRWNKRNNVKWKLDISLIDEFL